MKTRPSLLACLALITMSGCTTVRFANKHVDADGIVRFHIHATNTYESHRWLLDSSLENMGDRSIIVQLRDIHCFRGEHEGEIEYRTLFGIGERSIDLKPGETKALNVKCGYPTLEAAPKGRVFRLTISRVFADRTGEGHALGEVLARDIEWVYESPQDAPKEN